VIDRVGDIAGRCGEGAAAANTLGSRGLAAFAHDAAIPGRLAEDLERPFPVEVRSPQPDSDHGVKRFI